MEQKGLSSDKKRATNSVLDQKYLTALSINRKWVFPDNVLTIAHKPKRICAYEKNPHGQLLYE